MTITIHVEETVGGRTICADKNIDPMYLERFKVSYTGVYLCDSINKLIKAVKEEAYGKTTQNNRPDAG